MFATRFDVSSSETAAKVSKKAQLLKKLKNKNNTTDNNVAKVESVKLNKDTEGDITMVDTEVEDKNMKEEKYEKNKVNMDIDDTDDEKNELKRKRDSTSDSDPDSDSDSDSAAEEDIGHAGYERSSVTDADDTTPHTSVLSRFKKAMINQSETHTGEEEEINEAEITEFKDVAPLPQLKLPRDRQLYSQSHKNNSLDWLTTPAYYDSNMTKPFKEFNPTLHKIILKNLNKDFEIENAFSVQITLIQELLQDINRGKFDPTPRGDYLINAATGSGKTLSYLIPIVQYILGTNDEIRIKDAGIQCVIIVPTKPLVHQVYSDALKLTKGTDINVMALKSGGDMSINEERLKLESNLVDILIATPGRLVEHLNSIETTCLRFLVVDEADRLLNQNFQDWCDLLMNKIERNSNIEDESMDFYFKQRCIKIVLSATLTTNSEKLTHLRLFKPRLVIVNTDNTNELYQLPRSLDEKYLRIPEKLSYFKPLILSKFFQWVDKIGNRYDNFGLIFTKSNESSIRLNNLLNSISEKFGLQDKICINTINSMMDNQERSKILKRFDENGGILICTDLLSRGINLNSIKFVINYDLPTSTKEYIHRIGRTARAGNFGSAVTLCYGEGEFKWFKKVVYSGQQINRNGKKLVDIKFVKEINSEEDDKEDESVDNFELNLTDSDKEVYEACLKNLV